MKKPKQGGGYKGKGFNGQSKAFADGPKSYMGYDPIPEESDSIPEVL